MSEADIPDEAVRLAMASRSRDLIDLPDPMVLSDAQLTRRMLEAAAPAMAEEVAKAILRHRDEYCPDGDAAGKWRRYFGIAARIAAGAFTTEDEMKQQAAEAIDAGEFYVCDLGEDGQPK